MCPQHQSVDDFALALRSIGEPLQGRTASDISMAKVLGQLFATTELFDMQTRPELVLLQKIDGAGRGRGAARSTPTSTSGPIAEPVVGDWVRREAGPLGRLEDLARQPAHRGRHRSARLPGIVDAGRGALADYEAERSSPQRRCRAD